MVRKINFDEGVIAKEVNLYSSVVEKLQQKYPLYFQNILCGFLEEYDVETQEELNVMLKQFFYGWIFLDYLMIDGKKIIDFCIEMLDLSKNELLMLEKIKSVKRGFFKINDNSNNVLKVTDIITKQKYDVSIIDFELKKGIIKANLVYNLENNLFLFGGVEKIDKAKQYLREEGLI